MRITEMTNLFVGYNPDENFRVLICALDIQEANYIAETYLNDSHMKGKFTISTPESKDLENMHFDCDYILIHDHVLTHFAE